MLGLVGLLLAGCSVVVSGLAGRVIHPPAGDPESDWVVITYTLQPGAEASAMDVLLETELAAEAALRDTGAGVIDGNEVGDGEYQLYFLGPDRHRMWQVLKPVFAAAPLTWSRVELFQSLNEEPVEVILPR